MFDNLKSPRQILQYNLFKGVTDWTNFKQFDYYEKGYPFLLVLRYPKFIELNLQYESPATIKVVKNYLHILEHEFVGLEGIENITSANGEFTNGIKTVNYINKVEQAAGTFTMEFRERAGMPITKFNKYFLTGVKDSETQVKHYHGLIDRLRGQSVGNGVQGPTLANAALTAETQLEFEPGVDKEVFTFLYFVTDNTMSKVEAAHLICGAQPTQAELSIADQKKGEIDNATLSCQFQGICLSNDFIDAKAQACLDIMRDPTNSTSSRVLVNSTKFAYREASRIKAEGTTYTSMGDNVNSATINSYGLTGGTLDSMKVNGTVEEHSIGTSKTVNSNAITLSNE